ncbi:SPOC like C-terminal domain-containing protein [Calycina marina]|uniref:ATP-dependent DNA helicase II subunit 1 n=1 Tax=Calycina marina TaxID=1763456 RepID=A0A9P8CAM3_9HELO|nr:SPOC like C-terminal domain-containing protein [Calycina marina]
MSNEKPSWMHNQDEEEDEEETQDETNYKQMKDAVIFAIDISESMLTSPEDDPKADSPAMAALNCASHFMEQRIISNPKDMMGILLFGTESTNLNDEGNTSGKDKYPHCYLLTELDVPSAKDVRRLKELISDSAEANALLVPTSGHCRISDLLFCANQRFNLQAPNFDSRRLFVITDSDSPHDGDKKAMSVSTTRAKDLYDLGVVIELFPISRPEETFDRTKFYDNIIYRDPNENENTYGVSTFKSSGIGLLQDLLSDINSKQVAKRSLFNDLKFEIGPGLEISVKGYNILQKQIPARSHFVYTGGEEAVIVEGKTNQNREISQESVVKKDLKKAYKFGGSQVLFEKKDVDKVKDFGGPVIRLVGFKPKSMLPIWASVKKSTFIYPSEGGFVGSIRVFVALWKKLLDNKKMGIAWCIPRKNAAPTYVAILPSEEKLADNGKQISPQGLWLYQIPFADDLRSPPDVPKPIRASDELVDDMRKVVQQLQLPKATYDPRRYPNPSLQWHYTILQAMALEQEPPEKASDKTTGKHKQIDKRAGEYIKKWGTTLDKQARAFMAERKSSLKRELGVDVEEDKPKKKAKTAATTQKLEDMADSDVNKLAASGLIGKCVIAELKAWCAMKGLPSTGKKADLVDRVERWCDEN